MLWRSENFADCFCVVFTFREHQFLNLSLTVATSGPLKASSRRVSVGRRNIWFRMFFLHFPQQCLNTRPASRGIDLMNFIEKKENLCGFEGSSKVVSASFQYLLTFSLPLRFISSCGAEHDTWPHYLNENVIIKDTFLNSRLSQPVQRGLKKSILVMKHEQPLEG